jgi:hypothetical protein
MRFYGQLFASREFMKFFVDGNERPEPQERQPKIAPEVGHVMHLDLFSFLTSA